ncbi:MAG: sugar phosphate isomerase/epimerase family protein [Gaiellaceae bacterium]
MRTGATSAENRALRLATAPVSWGIWEQTIERSDLVPPQSFLETVTAIGYRAIESGPPGYLAPDGAAAVELLRPFQIEVVATFLPLRLDDEQGFVADLAALDRATEVLAATGGRLVILADAERPERVRASGRPERMRELAWSDTTLDEAARRLERALERCAERGLRAAIHPHAATCLETQEETEAILERTPSELGLCLDTGHAVVGGADPLELARRYGSRLLHLHLKDVDGTVLEQLREGRIDMNEAWPQGLFCPFGEGVVPLADFLGLPEVRGLDGFAVLEQDRIAVTIDDLPAVRAVEERNLERVQHWLSA